MKIFDIALKDLTRSLRNFFALGMMFVVPLLITGLIYMAFGGAASGKSDLPATRLALVNQDVPVQDTNFGQMLADMATDPSVQSWLKVSMVSSESDAVAMVNRQEADVALIVPAGFSQSIVSREGKPEVKIIHDPTLTIAPMVIRNMVGSLIDGAAGARVAMDTVSKQAEAQGKTPSLQDQMALVQKYGEWFVPFQRTLYHTDQAVLLARAPSSAAADPQASQQEGLGRILAWTMAGQMIFFCFYTGAYSMTSILTEQEEGTLARLFTTPTNRIHVLSGKFLAVLLMCLVQAAVMLLAGALLFKIQWGSPISVFLSVIAQVIGATGLGVLLISLIKTSKQVGPVLGGALSLLGILGGLFTVGMPQAPKVFDLSGMFTPQGWTLRIWKSTLAGGAPADLLLPLLALSVMGLVMFAIGARIFQRRFA